MERLYIIDSGHSISLDKSRWTPGHTPGSEVLLVKLRKFGAAMLSGDAVHFTYSLVKRYVPSNNVNREQTMASYQRIEQLLAQHKAQLWVNHDKKQSDTLKKSPEHYE